MNQATENPDYLSVLLAGAQAASQRDAWKSRCEALQAELITQEVRHREVADGLRADLEDMDAQRQHWVRVAQGEMARRGEVQEDIAEKRDWCRRALAESRLEVRRLTDELGKTRAERDQLRAARDEVVKRNAQPASLIQELQEDVRDLTRANDELIRARISATEEVERLTDTLVETQAKLEQVAMGSQRLADEWRLVTADHKVILEDLVETQAERDRCLASARAWEIAACDIRDLLPTGLRLPMSFQAAIDTLAVWRTSAEPRQEPAVWTACQEYRDLGQTSYAAWCVRFYDGADSVPSAARWSQQGRLAQESWAYVACCHSAGPDNARALATILRQKYADNEVFQRAIR